MHQPIYEMGQESMKLMLSRINGNKSEATKMILPSYLVERTSVKKLK
jgi:DNA-binding LacI/PurR family transcriptional regulator